MVANRFAFRPAGSFIFPKVRSLARGHAQATQSMASHERRLIPAWHSRTRRSYEGAHQVRAFVPPGVMYGGAADVRREDIPSISPHCGGIQT
jgi:hypothetical protein